MSLLDGDIREDIGDAFNDLDPFPVTLSRMVGGTHNPETGHTPGAVEQTWVGRGIIMDYSDFSLVTSQLGAGNVQVGDRKVLIARQGFDVTPALGDTLTIMGITYQVVSAKTDPANATWMIQVRI
jgi:hypothetical protein